MNTEPAITIGTVTAAVSAALALLVTFGVPLTEGQTAAILGVIAAVGPIVAAVWTRRRVTPTSQVQVHRTQPE